MDITTTHKFEQSVINILNLDGWNLEWCGGNYEHYDSKGFTPKQQECVIEMKFRNKYYESKMLEKYKYDKLMQVKDVHKFYLVFDPKGMYMFWLNGPKFNLPIPEDLYCPDTTLWTKKKENKKVYLLEESQASLIRQENGFHRIV